MLSFTETS